MTGMNRRRHERRPLQTYAALETRGLIVNDQAFLAVVDVSRGGIGLRTGQPPEVGEPVVLRLAIGEDIHTIDATVARVAPRGHGLFDIGLDWSHCDPTALAFLDQFLAAQVAAHDEP
jgi:hypothetical protein